MRRPAHITMERLVAVRGAGGGQGMPGFAGLGREALFGCVAAIVTLGHCLAYNAVIFAGDLNPGLALGLWGFLAASAIATIAAAFTTTLPPVICGPRNPVVAVMSVLAAAIAGNTLAAGGTTAEAVRHVLLALAIAAFLTGVATWALGRFRLGQIVRFVPFPVIGGFLAASGLLLVAGGFKLAFGRPIDLHVLAGATATELARLWVAVAFVAAVYALRRFVPGAALLPLLFVMTVVTLDIALAQTGRRVGWFLEAGQGTAAWSPLSIMATGRIDWGILLRSTVEILTIVAVSVLTLPLDVSALEVLRDGDADIDREFRASGAVNTGLALIGGQPVGTAPNASRLLDEFGATSRFAGLAGGFFLGGVLLTGLDVASLVPTPLLGGLAIYLGIGMLADALLRSPARGAPVEIALALAIMATIVQFGYLTGVILGLVTACLLFAMRYSRIDAIRRHVTRAEFASGVERAPDDRARLVAEGRRIHVVWLNGFVFFGSANRIYEAIRRRLNGAAAEPKNIRRFVVLDLAGVSGMDSSAVVSFVKLRQWADGANVTVVLAAMPAELGAGLRMPELAKGTRVFAGRSDALEWCEDQVLADLAATNGAAEAATGAEAFAAWLAAEIGRDRAEQLVARYLERRSFAQGDVVCRRGEPSDVIHFVEQGSVKVVFADAHGREIVLRRMVGCTVVGEMGFFRGAERAATVVAERPASVLLLQRQSYNALVAEEPALACALLELVARMLSDRVDFANREIAALI